MLPFTDSKQKSSICKKAADPFTALHTPSLVWWDLPISSQILGSCQGLRTRREGFFSCPVFCLPEKSGSRSLCPPLIPPSALLVQPVHLAKVSGHIGGRHRGCYQLPYGSGRRRCGDGGSYTSAGRQIFQNALCNHQQNKSSSQNNLLIFANLTLM